MSFLGPFEHTKGSSWGGSQISPLVLKVITVLGGFLGLDHLLLRSPKTAIAKLITNIFTLGFWYFYDIIQVFKDTDFIQKYGYTIPGLGPVGLGAGLLHSPTTPQAPEISPSPFYYLGYALMIAIPFGFSHFLAGDYYGGAAKFFLSYIIFTFLIGWVWAGYSTVNLIFNTPDILKNGTDRMFPATLVMDSHGPAPNLKMPDLKPKTAEEQANSLFDWIFSVLGFLKPIEKPILETIVKAGDTVTGVASVAKTTAQQIESTTTTAAPAVASVLQKGGSLEFEPGSLSGPIFFGVSALIFVGAILTTFLRFQRSKQTSAIEYKQKNDVPPEVSDEPPSGSRAL